MNRQEVAKIIYTIKAVYPNQFKGFTAADYENLIAAWAAVLDEYTYSETSAGLKAYLSGDNKGFAPSPGQVIDCIHKLREAKEQRAMTPLEAWSYVSKASKNSIYNSVKEFEKLPEICKRVVGNSANLKEMAMMTEEQVNTIEQSHFIRSYNTELKRQQDIAKLPKALRKALRESHAAVMLPDMPD